jgi:hypothetical protein
MLLQDPCRAIDPASDSTVKLNTGNAPPVYLLPDVRKSVVDAISCHTGSSTYGDDLYNT